MDIRGFIIVGIVIVGATIIFGIIEKMTRLIFTAIGTVILIMGVMYVLPPGVKASVDLSLTLTGAKVFKNIPEESIEVLKSGYIRFEPAKHVSVAIPKYEAVKDAPVVTSKNVHDWNMDMFTITQEYRGTTIKYFPKDEDKFKAILEKNGL